MFLEVRPTPTEITSHSLPKTSRLKLRRCGKSAGRRCHGFRFSNLVRNLRRALKGRGRTKTGGTGPWHRVLKQSVGQITMASVFAVDLEFEASSFFSTECSLKKDGESDPGYPPKIPLMAQLPKTTAALPAKMQTSQINHTDQNSYPHVISSTPYLSIDSSSASMLLHSPDSPLSTADNASCTSGTRGAAGGVKSSSAVSDQLLIPTTFQYPSSLDEVPLLRFDDGATASTSYGTHYDYSLDMRTLPPCSCPKTLSIPERFEESASLLVVPADENGLTVQHEDPWCALSSQAGVYHAIVQLHDTSEYVSCVPPHSFTAKEQLGTSLSATISSCVEVEHLLHVVQQQHGRMGASHTASALSCAAKIHSSLASKTSKDDEDDEDEDDEVASLLLLKLLSDRVTSYLQHLSHGQSLSMLKSYAMLLPLLALRHQQQGRVAAGITASKAVAAEVLNGMPKFWDLSGPATTPPRMSTDSNPCPPLYPYENPSESPAASHRPQSLHSFTISAWAAARLGLRPVSEKGTAWLHSFLSASESVLRREQVSPKDLSLLLWALAVMRLYPGRSWSSALSSALGKLLEPSHDRMKSCHISTGSQVPRLGPQAVSVMMWATAKLQLPLSSSTYNLLRYHCLQELPKFNHRHLSTTMWAVATMEHSSKRFGVGASKAGSIHSSKPCNDGDESKGSFQSEKGGSTCCAHLDRSPTLFSNSGAGLPPCTSACTSTSSTPSSSSSVLMQSPGRTRNSELIRPLHYTALKLQTPLGSAPSNPMKPWVCADEGLSSSSSQSPTLEAAIPDASALHSLAQTGTNDDIPCTAALRQALPSPTQCSTVQLLAASSTAAKQLLRSMTFQGLAVTAWSQARIAYVPDAGWTSELLAAAVAVVQEAPEDVTIESLNMLLWSLTRWGTRPSQAWFTQMTESCALRSHLVPMLTPSQAASMLTSIVELRGSPDHSFLHAVQHCTEAKLGSSCSPVTAVRLCSALGTGFQMWPGETWLRRMWGVVMREGAPSLTPGEVATLLSGMADMPGPSTRAASSKIGFAAASAASADASVRQTHRFDNESFAYVSSGSIASHSAVQLVTQGSGAVSVHLQDGSVPTPSSPDMLRPEKGLEEGQGILTARAVRSAIPPLAVRWLLRLVLQQKGGSHFSAAATATWASIRLGCRPTSSWMSRLLSKFTFTDKIIRLLDANSAVQLLCSCSVLQAPAPEIGRLGAGMGVPELVSEQVFSKASKLSHSNMKLLSMLITGGLGSAGPCPWREAAGKVLTKRGLLRMHSLAQCTLLNIVTQDKRRVEASPLASLSSGTHFPSGSSYPLPASQQPSSLSLSSWTQSVEESTFKTLSQPPSFGGLSAAARVSLLGCMLQEQHCPSQAWTDAWCLAVSSGARRLTSGQLLIAVKMAHSLACSTPSAPEGQQLHIPESFFMGVEAAVLASAKSSAWYSMVPARLAVIASHLHMMGYTVNGHLLTASEQALECFLAQDEEMQPVAKHCNGSSRKLGRDSAYAGRLLTAVAELAPLPRNCCGPAATQAVAVLMQELLKLEPEALVQGAVATSVALGSPCSTLYGQSGAATSLGDSFSQGNLSFMGDVLDSDPLTFFYEPYKVSPPSGLQPSSPLGSNLDRGMDSGVGSCYTFTSAAMLISSALQLMASWSVQPSQAWLSDIIQHLLRRHGVTMASSPVKTRAREKQQGMLRLARSRKREKALLASEDDDGGMRYDGARDVAACVQMTGPEVASVLRGIALLQVPVREECIQGLLKAMSFPALMQLHSRQAPEVAWALAVLQYRPDSAWWEQYERMLMSTSGMGIQPNGRSSTWPVSLLHLPGEGRFLPSTPPPAVPQALIDRLSGLQLCELAWACASMHLVPSQALLSRLALAAADQLPSLPPSSLSSLLWSLTVLDPEGDALSAPVSASVEAASKHRYPLHGSFHAATAPTPVLTLSWRAWMDKWLSEAYGRLGGFSAQDLAMTVTALSEMRFRPRQEWLSRFLSQVMLEASNCRGSQLVRITCGLAELGCSPEAEWLEAVQTSAREVASELEAGAAGQLAWALEKLSGSRRQRAAGSRDESLLMQCSLMTSKDEVHDRKKLSRRQSIAAEGALTAAVQKQYSAAWNHPSGGSASGGDLMNYHGHSEEAGHQVIGSKSQLQLVGMNHRLLKSNPTTASSLTSCASGRHSSQSKWMNTFLH
ncbi:hypothetical protein CEUSTIGMA_g4462.t1 [Chlamydomonas eustigma]|uniref:Uncharacterized protein n=1 Tax=Chlamydomonas eustigma TaxID=1157962 RepID=A0A250X1T3_9CHLO|nr:hypothetical protein CEUSTIGMA_g4462.t1 [Chlamydomonas eustigma]|eukprot:GAX77015.1 hypothetical protein CEUSTIGMA_g4462.t1 [Chlamydomonas eustigma]